MAVLERVGTSSLGSSPELQWQKRRNQLGLQTKNSRLRLILQSHYTQCFKQRIFTEPLKVWVGVSPTSCVKKGFCI
jgi:hypothetical protein